MYARLKTAGTTGTARVSYEQDFFHVEMDAGDGRRRFDAPVFLWVGEGDRGDI